MIDVTGRELAKEKGKGRPTQYTQCNDPKNHLVNTEKGLAPVDCHTGLTGGAHGRRHLDPNHLDLASRPTGKKHIEMVHAQPMDMAKRLTGKYGLKKIQAPRAEERQQREKAHLYGNLTCEERAARAVRNALAKDPTLAAELAPALEGGGVGLIRAEQKLNRRQMVDQRQKVWAQKKAREGPERPKSADLGVKTLVDKPFATFGGDKPPTFHPAKRLLSGPDTKHEEHHGKRIIPNVTDIPFDTVGANNAPYPDPPSCGKRQPVSTGKHQIPMPHRDDKDLDVIARDKAEAKLARGAASLADQNRQAFPDFVLGSPPPPKAPRRNTAHNFSQIDFMHRPATAGANKAQGGGEPRNEPKFAALKYKKTALW